MRARYPGSKAGGLEDQDRIDDLPARSVEAISSRETSSYQLLIKRSQAYPIVVATLHVSVSPRSSYTGIQDTHTLYNIILYFILHRFGKYRNVSALGLGLSSGFPITVDQTAPFQTWNI